MKEKTFLLLKIVAGAVVGKMLSQRNVCCMKIMVMERKILVLAGQVLVGTPT